MALERILSFAIACTPERLEFSVPPLYATRATQEALQRAHGHGHGGDGGVGGGAGPGSAAGASHGPHSLSPVRAHAGGPGGGGGGAVYGTKLSLPVTPTGGGAAGRPSLTPGSVGAAAAGLAAGVCGGVQGWACANAGSANVRRFLCL
jgi:hypothetical protein